MIGAAATCTLSVTNAGSIVETYTLSIVGELEPYASVEPGTLSLYPGSEGSATVTILVPADANLPAGDLPFGVLVTPTAEPGETEVPEAVAHLQPTRDVTAELTPRTSHGSRNGRHSLALDNRGNEPVTVALSGKDPDAVLEFRFRPSTLVVPPNSAAFATVRAHPLERIWRGAPRTRQFSIVAALVTPDAPAVPVAQVDATMLQDPLLPPWTGKVVAAALVAIAALGGLWFLALKPAMKSTAEDAVAAPLASVSAKAEEARVKAEQAGEKADNAKDTSSGTEKKVTKDLAEKEAEIAAREASLIGQPFGERWALSAKPGKSVDKSYTVPKDKILQVTDISFESQGSTAVIEWFRDDYSFGAVQARNFRDIHDYHNVSPYVFTEGQKLVVKLSCTTPAPGATSCENAFGAVGSLLDKPKPTPTPSPTPS